IYSRFLVAIIAIFTGSKPPGYGWAGISINTDASARQMVPKYSGRFSIDLRINTNNPTVNNTVKTVRAIKAPFAVPNNETK
ncbi:MAG TPA: hypothetical protein VII94_01830, partial [Candidatus Saccharimonadales bacterium]